MVKRRRIGGGEHADEPEVVSNAATRVSAHRGRLRRVTLPAEVTEGMVVTPVVVTLFRFWPGAWLPPWLVQVKVAAPVPVSVIVMSPLPRPASFAYGCLK